MNKMSIALRKMEKLNATERQIVQSLSEPMVERDSESEDGVINSTSCIKYNTESSNDSVVL